MHLYYVLFTVDLYSTLYPAYCQLINYCIQLATSTLENAVYTSCRPSTALIYTALQTLPRDSLASLLK